VLTVTVVTWIIIYRDYRGDVSPSSLERFLSRVIEGEDTGIPPVFEDEGVNFAYVKHNNIYGAFLHPLLAVYFVT
jgi:hypothetical protein